MKAVCKVHKVYKVRKVYKARRVRKVYKVLKFGFFIFHFSLFTFHSAFAQQKNVDTIQVNVITQYKPVINDAAKLNTNPVIADTTKVEKKVDYNLLNSQFPTYYTPPTLDSIQIKNEPLPLLYHSLLNAGAGNYGTLYAEYFFNSTRSKDVDYGIHLNHLSSDATLANYGYSGYSFNDVNMYIKKTFGQHSLYAQADYDEHVVHDYGYNPYEDTFGLNKNNTREQYNLFGGSVKYKSEYENSSKINHEAKVGYYNYSNHSTTENNVNANLNLFSNSNHLGIGLKGRMEYYDYTNNYSYGPIGVLSINTLDILLNPFFDTYEKRWDVHLGVNGYLIPAINSNPSKINIYPDLLARVHIAGDVVMLYAGVDGNQTYNSYKYLSTENPFVDEFPQMQYTYVQYHAFGGITGSITSQLTYNASVAQSQINNMPLFTSAPGNNQFFVVYDNVKVFNIHGDLDYKLKSNFSVSLGADYNMYTPTIWQKVWYHPAFKAILSGKYTLNHKYIFHADFFYVGSQYASETSINTYGDTPIILVKRLSAYPDLNLGIDYIFNKTFTAFLNLNNLANVTYYQWDNYPMQRFNFVLGIRLGF